MAHGTVSLDKVIDKADHTGVLNLAGRNLRQFPMSAQDLSDLQDTLEADISRNRFDKVPREICMFSGLETLNCHHNSIRTVPDYITYMGSLQKLDLSRNFITSLPPEICRLNLVSLNLSHNRLVCIPIDIGSMMSLKRLDLSCNLLPDLPSGLCNLTKLKYLNLHNNELKELPQEIDKLPLDFLDVSTNLIKTIPTSLRHVKSLITFDISDNPLESPPAHVCVRGRVHIFKYLQSLDQRGPDPVVYHPTPADIKKRGRGVRKSRPVSGVSCVSVESSTSSFADEMHRFVDTAFGNFTTSHKELHKSDTDLTLRDGHSRSHVSSSSLSSASPGRRRVNNAYATLPRNGPETKTIVEEPPPPEPVVVKQSSVPAEDNKRVNQGRSLPGEQKPRSGSWNSQQRKTEEVRDHSRESRDHKVSTPVISSKTPDIERKPSPSTSNYAMRNAKSSSDVRITNQSSTKEITKGTNSAVTGTNNPLPSRYKIIRRSVASTLESDV